MESNLDLVMMTYNVYVTVYVYAQFASKLDDFEQDTIRDSVITCTAGNSKVENLLFSTGKPTVEKSQVRGPIGPTLVSNQVSDISNLFCNFNF